MWKKIETYLGALLVGEGVFQVVYLFLDMYGRAEVVNELLHAGVFRWLANPSAILIGLGCGIVLLFRGDRLGTEHPGLYDSRGKQISPRRPRFHAGWSALSASILGVLLFGAVHLVAAHKAKTAVVQGPESKTVPLVTPPPVAPAHAAPPKKQVKYPKPVTACSDARVASVGEQVWTDRRIAHPDESPNLSACAVDAALRKRGWPCSIRKDIPAPSGNNTGGVYMGSASHGNTFERLHINGMTYGIVNDGSDNHFTDTEINGPQGQTIACGADMQAEFKKLDKKK
jgi:hypothetical protein